MTAKEFWKKFESIFEDAETKNAAISYWYSPKYYTKFILDNIADFLKDEFETTREYYRIDLIGWKQLRGPETDKCLLPGFLKSLWDLEVAVEHENSSSSWMDEVIKLLHICCPLRVVIGYLPIAQKNNHQSYLKEITKQIQDIKAVNEYNNLNNGEFMIIIGDSHCSDDESKYCKYRGYLFNKDTKSFDCIGEI